MRRIVLVAGLLVVALLSTAATAVAAPDKGVSATNRARAESVLSEVENLLAGREVRTGRELTPALLDLARRRRALSASDKRRADGILARPTAGASDQFGDGYTVPEAAPVCGTNFCVHYVTSTEDAPSLADTSPANGIPDYVERMLAEFEFTFTVENGNLGWVQPKSDGTKGGDSGKTDAYIAQIGDQSIFGYAATDPEDTATRSAYGYLVMDDDYSAAEFPGYADPLLPLQVTAAHEYNHVLQFTYDWIQDKWMLESTATWMEEQVYPGVNDYVSYLPSWAGCTEPPVTEFDPPGTSCDLKVYGTAVWNHFLEFGFGEQVVRAAWERSQTTTPDSDFAPDAYDEAMAACGGSGFTREFGIFAATLPEWRAAGVYPDAAGYPNVERIGASLTTNGTPRTEVLDHTSFRLIDVTPDPSQTAIQLRADVPPGLAATLALVGRTGADPAAGTVDVQFAQVPADGHGAVSLGAPGSYGRITAVLANADPSQAGFAGADWVWTRDAQAFSNVQVVPSGTSPAATAPAALGGRGACPAGGGTGTPAPPPPPPPAATALTSGFSLKKVQKLAIALRRGVLAKVRCSRACKVRVELRLDRRTARRLRLKREVGTMTVTLTKAGAKSVRVKLSRKARARFKRRRSVKLTAAMRATSGGVAAKRRTATVTLRR